MSSASVGATLEAVQDALAGAWSLERVLGIGGMGTVFLARDVSLDRPVAIKVLHPDLAARVDQRERFLREARTGARLSHPHIVPIYAVDELGGVVFFVMGLVDGESLGSRLRREGPVSGADAERILHEVGWGLAYAHAMGIVHRDVTLDNILLERNTGRALLADFGIAAEVDRAEAGPLLGTPAYLAPELIRGESAGPVSDIYALGITAWTMLAGRFPFDGEDTAAVLLQHVTAPLPSLASAAPATSPRVVRAIERCLERDPAARPESVEALLALLQRPGSGTTLAAPMQRWVSRGARIRPAWAFAAPLVGMLSISAFTSAMMTLEGLDLIGTILRSTLLVLIPTLLLQAIFEWRELRLALRAGYGLEDLRLALQRHLAEREVEAPPLLGRVMHDIAWLSIGGILLMTQAIRYAPLLVHNWETFVPFVKVVVDLARWCWMLLWTGIGAAFVIRMRRTTPRRSTTLTERFWGSRLGGLAARLAAVGLRGAIPPETTLHRPTELVLDLAIEELWAELPESSRLLLDDLPALASGLRHRIAEMKALRRHLTDPGLPQSPGHLLLERQLSERETAAITALEGLRLQLARLTLDVASAGEFTGQLADARSLEMELLEELGGHGALRRVLRPGRPREATPATTPG
ncbi:MAG: serine/threonine-protein kinase [Gemmatimonadales bacterium]